MATSSRIKNTRGALGSYKKSGKGSIKVPKAFRNAAIRAKLISKNSLGSDSK